MRGAVFTDTLRYSLRDLLVWGGGIAAMGYLIAAMVPAFESVEFIEMMEGFPPALLAMMGLGDDLSTLATPEGIIAVGFFSKMLIIFAAYPVIMGLRITTNDEDRGILDMVLSLPVARVQLILEKFAAYALNIAAVVIFATLGLLAGVFGTGLDANIARLTVISLSMMPLLLFILAFTAFLGAVIRRRTVVITIVTAFIMGSFMLYTIDTMVNVAWMDALARVSFFAYFDPQLILANGFMPVHVSILLVGALVLLVSSVTLFERRDLA